MANLALYNFIVYNLLQINLRNVLIFHCWQLPALLPLGQLFSHNLIFSQYINLNQSNERLANFTKVYLDSDLTKLGVFLDMSCEQSDFITNQSSRAQLYTQNLHWLLYDKSGNMERFVELFAKANLSVNADVTYVKEEKIVDYDSLFTLYDAYNSGSQLGGQLNITIDQSIYCTQTKCELKQYLSELYKRTRVQQRMDLSGITFRQVALVTVMPLSLGEEKLLNFLNSEDNVHLDWTSRVGYRNNLHLQEVLRFNISYIWRDLWSVNDSQGGAIGEISNANAELSTSPFVLSSQRLRYILATMEISQFRSICIFRTPHNAGIKAGVFLEPFKFSVWLVFVALLILAGVLLWLTFRLEHRWMQHCMRYIPSLLTSCLISFGAACIQGSHLIPNSTGGRLAFIALMMTSFLMYNYYTSIVVSTLLGSPVRSNIKTMQQLADSSLDVGFETIPFTRTYLNSSPRSDIRDLVKRKVDGHDPSKIWLSVNDGVLRARDEPGFVFVSEASNLYTFIEKYYLPHEICELNEIMFRPESNVYAVVPKNSTYKELLKQIQVRMLETGITQKHKLFYTKTKLHCFANNYVIKVGMEYAAPLFIGLLLSYLAAIITLMLELGWAYLGRRQTQSLLIEEYLYYFLHIAKLNNILFLHCWTTDSLFHFAQLASKEMLYTQYINLNYTHPLAEQLQDKLVNHNLVKLGIYLDINCHQSVDVLSMANVKRLFVERYHWLIYDQYFTLSKVHEQFDVAQLYIGTELTYVEPSPKLDSFILYDLYNKGKHIGAKLNITIDRQINCNDQHCYLSHYLSDLHKRNRLQQRRYLTGLTLRVNAVINALPLNTPHSKLNAFLMSSDDLNNDAFARLGYQTHLVLRDMLDCNYSFIFRDRWSDSELTGGLLADMRNESVDVTANAFLITSGRLKYFKVMTWLSSFRSMCMFLNPKSSAVELRISEFLQPFSWTVWLMFGSLLVIAGFLLWMTFRLERRLNHMDMKPSLLTSCLLSFGAACIQGAWVLPRSTGGRMVFYAVMLTCFLLYNYYTSVVVSTLLGDPPKSNIRTIQQLADSNLEVSVEPTIYTKVYIETSTYPDVRSLYLNKILNSKRDTRSIWLSSEEGVRMVRNIPGFVYITEASSSYTFVRKHFLPHEICELNEILLRDETNAYTMVVKNSSYFELLKLNQLRMLETGIHFKYFRYWVRNKLHCYHSNRNVVVGMDSAGPLFLLLTCGYVVCLFVLALEILWHRRQQHAARH
ncbi:uncharacterized protein LOC111597335 [Drosophila hydei]|uniref:Ionotropic receptor 75a n=1 Tax=Drosophila hydei TaxID=7224 RepID=A0A6J2T0H2_DROHY|nr:uncharacterized protein LOC111597335 [Drosophila hydei]